MVDLEKQQMISVIGLGAMGATLARAFLMRGHAVNVWNRSASRAAPLVEEGANAPASLAATIQLSDLIVVCTIDKAATVELLTNSDAWRLLAGKTVVNLSTGSVEEARAIAAHVTAHGGDYIDGGIMGYPRDIGKAGTLMLYGGSAAAYAKYTNVLSALGGCMRFLGEDPGVVPNVYLALYGYYFGCVTSFFEGAALAETSGISPSVFLDAAKNMQAMLDDALLDSTERLVSGNFSGEQATIDVHHAGQLVVQQAFVSQALPSRVTDAYIHYMEHAQRAGDGPNDIATLYPAIQKAGISVGKD